jgi:hypothetical protein
MPALVRDDPVNMVAELKAQSGKDIERRRSGPRVPSVIKSWPWSTDVTRLYF